MSQCIFSINLPIGKAKPQMCTQLAQTGIKLGEFCKDFNKDNYGFTEGQEVTTRIIVNNKKYKINIKGISTTNLVKKYAINNKIKIEDAEKIVENLKEKVFAIDEEKVMKILQGVLKSMNITIN